MTKIKSDELQLQHQSFQWLMIQGWSPLRLIGLISLLSKGLSGVFSSTTVWRHQFFGDLPSLYGPALTRLKHLLTMWGTWVWSLGSIHGQEDPLEKEMATHSSILAWRIHGWRSLVGYSPRGRKELDMTEWLHFHFHWEDYSLDYTDLCWQNNVSAFQHIV